MKQIIVFLIIVYTGNLKAQGNFAGSWKSLIETVYREEKDLAGLQGFTSRGGALLSEANDPDKFAVSWFSKGTTFVALFEIVKEDNTRQILDVLEIKNAGTGQELKIGECKDGDSEINVALVALVLPVKKKQLKAIKAWHFNRDKIRIEAWPAAAVTCLGIEGDD